MHIRQAANINNTKTAGNTKCRSGNSCDYREGTTYSWCYTDYSNYWDYCCTGPCTTDTRTFLWCPSGDKRQFCGSDATRDVSGRKCLDTHTCGIHLDYNVLGLVSALWCLVDLVGNWGYCCAPFSLCGKYGESYNWCTTSPFTKVSYAGMDLNWQYCTIN
ncbi:hypothetical protein ACJMK2_030506 [Sinanodonta woodiana]|uniref:Uncharacterized protein n=1 Tax=Sinanodonta woodiana TaxID=1069815 RepID=A0ABD3WVX7_SINWO